VVSDSEETAMGKRVVREGMACERSAEPVTLTFVQRVRQPYLWDVTCSGCGETWKTIAQPEEFGRPASDHVEEFLARRPYYERAHVEDIAGAFETLGTPWCEGCADWHEPSDPHTED
jgi:hypothetical protein